MMNVFSVLYIKRFDEHRNLFNIQNDFYNTFHDMFQPYVNTEEIIIL